ncbi:MAG: hypothetical protein WA821_06280 [Anaerolineales bacterium]
MTPSITPAKPGYKPALVFLALFSLALFAACQPAAGDRPGAPAAPSGASSPATPIARATFTHLPGDVYFLHQTETAAPTAYHPGGWQTGEALQTITPFYGLTATVIALTQYTCLLAYPDFCISPNVRLGCTALRDRGHHDFTVLPPDPYGYDKDGDGIGCDTEK